MEVPLVTGGRGRENSVWTVRRLLRVLAFTDPSQDWTNGEVLESSHGDSLDLLSSFQMFLLYLLSRRDFSWETLTLGLAFLLPLLSSSRGPKPAQVAPGRL